MTEIILYPTETLYALGVNALSPMAVNALAAFKGRETTKRASWLVRSIDDMKQYAEMSEVAGRVAAKFLPGPLTLVLRAHEDISPAITAADYTIGFRISTDQLAMNLIESYMQEHDAPLTCTSANVSGAPTLPTPNEILQQFGPRAAEITEIIDDGPRKGLASTIVRVVGDEITILREGDITEAEIRSVVA